MSINSIRQFNSGKIISGVAGGVVGGKKEIQIFNSSTHIVYVIVDNPMNPSYSHCALDIGFCTVNPITQNDTGMMITLSHYTKDHDLRTIHIKTNGQSVLQKMIKPTCYTKDREKKDGCMPRRHQGCINKSSQ